MNYLVLTYHKSCGVELTDLEQLKKVVPDNRQKYEKTRRDFKKLVWKNKMIWKEIWQKKTLKMILKLFFRYVNGKCSRRVPIGPLKNRQGELISDIEVMTEVLNNFFSSVFLNTGKLDDVINVLKRD